VTVPLSQAREELAELVNLVPCQHERVILVKAQLGRLDQR